MTGPNPYDYAWWLASRASGIVALALVTASVGLGLLMASKLLRRPGLNRVLVKMHEHLALTGLVAIAVHGITLLGDRWLNPGVAGITVPVHDVLPPAVHRARHRGRLPGGAARPVVLCEAPNRRAAVAQAPQGDRRRLRAGRGARARRRNRRFDPVAAGVPARHRRADPLPAARPDPASPEERGRAAPGRRAGPGSRCRSPPPPKGETREPDARERRGDRDRRRRPCRPALCRDAAAPRATTERSGSSATSRSRPTIARRSRKDCSRARSTRARSPTGRRAGTASKRSSCSWAGAPSRSSRRRRLVRTAAGEELRYDELLIATGSTPRRLPAGQGFDNVHLLRSVADAAALRRALRPGARLVVVGAGFIGQEVAATARSLGVEVTIVEAAARRWRDCWGRTWVAGSPICTARRARGSCSRRPCRGSMAGARSRRSSSRTCRACHATRS